MLNLDLVRSLSERNHTCAVDELTQAVARLIEDAAPRRRLCENARALAICELSWVGIAVKTLGVCWTLLAQKKAPCV